MKKINGLSIGDNLHLAVAATKSLRDFAPNVAGAFKGCEPSWFNSAVQTTYNRMMIWLNDLAIVENAINVQLAATCSRSLFEHLLDLKWLIRNPHLGEAFRAFTLVRRYDIASVIVDECNRDATTDKSIYRRELELVCDPERRKMRDALCLEHGWVSKGGEPKRPKHWWGENAEQRARTLDGGTHTYLKYYLNLYSTISNLIHPGGVGLDGMSATAIAGLFISLHAFAQQFFLEATDLVCKTFPVPAETADAFHKLFFGDAPYGKPYMEPEASSPPSDEAETVIKPNA